MHKDTKDLIEQIRKQGFVVKARGKHFGIFRTNGEPIVDDDGPLILSATPSEHRNRQLATARLRRAGVLPRRSDGEEERDPNEKHEDPKKVAERERVIRETQVKSRDRNQRTRLVRERLEPIVSKVGGWEKKGTQADLAHILIHHLKATAIKPPSSHASATQLVYQLRRGETLSEHAAEQIESLLDELERDDPQRRWYELLREQRGLPPETETMPSQSQIVQRVLANVMSGMERGAEPEPDETAAPTGATIVPPPEQVEPQPVPAAPSREAVERVVARAVREYAVPTLTFNVLAHMARGCATENQLETVLKLAEQVYELERDKEATA